ncbi:MAG: hypothetical protein DRQ88_07930 [Epsilonproteobacteria bacterium]|nr:MAG: hypothetical protein DRQ89_11245 [Campylobacterota bacterium]RLA66051.1 MAG: hypothetical protein DRQ88_07930 [Campylobacterota bacterium]
MSAKRLFPDKKFPHYTFVPGKNIHPEKDGGHMEGQVELNPPPMDPKKFWESETFLYALDLYNYGYYWEGHVWLEALWHAAHKEGLMGDFLKGLIKLCAAGVKAKTGQADPVKGHAKRARELFIKVGSQIHDQHFAGFSLLNLASQAEDISENAATYAQDAPIEGAIFPLPLYPQSRV